MSELSFRQEYLSIIFQKYDVSLSILFGSHAKGNSHANSDIDIAVMFGDVLRPYRVNEKMIKKQSLFLYTDLMNEFHTNKVDLAVLNYATPLLWYQVSQHGVLLFEKEMGTYRAFCIRALQRHNDARRFYEAEKQFLENFIGGNGP